MNTIVAACLALAASVGFAAPKALVLKPWKASRGGSVMKDLKRFTDYVRAQAPALAVQPAFSLDCPIDAKELLLLAGNHSVTHEFKFEEGCDLQGTVTMSIQPFAASVEVRHLGSFTHLAMKVRVTAQQYGTELLQYLLDWHADSAELSSPEQKQPFRFAMDYKVITSMAGEGVVEGRGGRVSPR